MNEIVDSDKIIDAFNEHVMGTYGRLPLVPAEGEGATVTDEVGRTYIDFGSGIGTNSLGFCDWDWAAAVASQAQTLQHVSNYYYTKINSELADKICGAAGIPDGKVFFGNSGAEANECAIKLARKYSYDKYGAGRHVILTLTNSFHGRTLATISATGQDQFHQYFFPFVEGFRYVTANNIADLQRHLEADDVCAVMFEYIQGEGGVVPLDKDFVTEIFTLCAEKDVLTIADEVQSGVGRTGAFLAGDHFDKKADVITLAKGLAGGLPIGVCLTKPQYAGVLTKGTHGSTFGGNPVCCAGALVVLDKVHRLYADIAAKSERIRTELSKVPEVAGIDGIGLMLGVRLKTKSAPDVLNACLEQGLLVLTAKDRVRLLPPLTISAAELHKGITILKKVLNS